MTSALGLFELLLVLLGAMSWGAYELWSVRRSQRPPPTPKANDERGR